MIRFLQDNLGNWDNPNVSRLCLSLKTLNTGQPVHQQHPPNPAQLPLFCDLTIINHHSAHPTQPYPSLQSKSPLILCCCDSSSRPAHKRDTFCPTSGSGRQTVTTQSVKLGKYAQGASLGRSIPNTLLRQIAPGPWSNLGHPSPFPGVAGWDVLELNKSPKEMKPNLGGKDAK